MKSGNIERKTIKGGKEGGREGRNVLIFGNLKSCYVCSSHVKL
jgi:hypothetical protein